MADEDKGAKEVAGAEGVVQSVRPGGAGIRVLAQFVKDISFESPRAPESLRSSSPPKIDLEVELAAQTTDEGYYNVDLKLIVAATRDNEVVFHVEVLYGGLFQIEGFPPEEMEPVLLIECPRYLFPFARRVIADLTGEGGFPPFRVDPLDFAGIYMARREAAEAKGPLDA